MKFCIGKDSITPAEPVFLSGFGDRTRKSEGVHDPIYVKAALLQSNKSLLIVTIDALGADRSFIQGVKDELKAKFGLEHDEVMINFSHTHASVYLTGRDARLRNGGYSMGQDQWTDHEEELDYTYDELYFDFVKEKLIHLVQHCLDHLEEGELLIGRTASHFGVSRRYRTNQGIEWRPSYDAEIDQDLFVLKLMNAKRDVKGILYAYGCHPTSMGSSNYFISGDYSGAASRHLEQSYPEAVAMFLQGCGAEIKPRKSADGVTFKECSIEEMEEAGAGLAIEINDFMQNGAFKSVSCSFRTMLLEPNLYTERTPVEHYHQILDDPESSEFNKIRVKKLLKKFEDGSIKDQVPLYIAIWQLDESTRIVAIEGEVSTGYSRMIKKLFGPDQTMVLGYTNGIYCYIPTREMIYEGGYEVDNFYYYGHRGPFVPEIEDIIIGQIASAFGRLSDRPVAALRVNKD
ncbi:neutral/alkaline non-lysosomal ceramidase N-terminal domain-containing protein [Paenibacillus contaminans]|uniref:neutral/alkaline non-lysosomal ceramidase N-terminal domain-containing protein n=1 Tax=Paenibacillus contaminans TaxID=450362 RepID=UPI0013143F0E|nr:neutral/alkaline non-lysosomal ceramidase N-terminal domain-containing protein [Paenibacillus contaminans]